MQLRECLRVKLKKYPKIPDLTAIEQLCYSDKPLYKTISRMYDVLISSNHVEFAVKSRSKWETDLEIKIDGDL